MIHQPNPQLLRVARVLAIIFALFILTLDVVTAYKAGMRPTPADLGGMSLEAAQSIGQPKGMVLRVKPGSAAEQAGIRAGDMITLHDTAGFLSRIVGRRVGLTVTSHGVNREASLPWSEKPPTGPISQFWWKFDIYVSVFGALLGTTVLVRTKPRRSSILIGLTIMSYSYAGYALALPADASDALILGTHAIDGFRGAASIYLLVAFARCLFEEEIGALTVRIRAGCRLVAGLVVLFGAGSVVANLTGNAYTLFQTGTVQSGVLQSAACTLCFVLLWMGWARSVQQVRLRYAVLLVSVGFLIVTGLAGSFFWLIPALFTLGEICFLAFLCTFAYAVLRHKVIDLGFAINRVVVYGVVSAAVLVTFGLAEWIAEHLVHFEDREKSVLLDGGIALGTYLAFHRVKHWVEHWIEKIFFRAWHDNEAKLHKFVREAVYISSISALWAQLEEELARFSGTPCQVFVRSGSEDFRAVDKRHDELEPLPIDENSKLSLTLQATRKPVVAASDMEVRSGSLAAPVFMRGVLHAIVIVYARANGVPFRPDEIEAIGNAVDQVGYDYLTLRLDKLERRDADNARFRALNLQPTNTISSTTGL